MRQEVLRQVDLFRELDETDIERLSLEFVEVLVPAEYPIFQEGEPLEAFYVVREGTVVVYRGAVGRPMQLLARLGPHDFFGELTLFERVDSSISARTTEPTRLLKIDRRGFLQFLEGHPEVTLRLQMAAAKRHTLHAAAALELGQRNEVRIRVDRKVDLTLDDGTTQVAVLDNLSPGGLGLRDLSRAATSWQEGEEISFELAVQGSSLPCSGRITWIHGDMLGFAFTATCDDHQMRVQALLRRLFPKKPKERQPTPEAPPRPSLEDRPV